jgi:2-phospho-L-lactate guanylyltransferase
MPFKVIALVPFKTFTQGKQRLRSALSRSAVEQVGRAMLADVVAALLNSQVTRTVVLTDDAEVAAAAQDCGAEVALRSPDPGLNPALSAASADAIAEGYGAALVVLGDLPLLRAEHIDRVLEAGEQTPIVLVPALDGGTALLYRRPPRCIPERFGANSAAEHRAAAQAAGMPWSELEDLDPDARADLDTLEDAQRILRSTRRSLTREVLEKYLR